MEQIIKLNRRRVIVEKVTKPHEVWFKSILNNLTHKTIDKEKYSDSIFFFNNNKCYFEYNQKYRYFWCDYDKVWSVFGTKYNMNYQQIQVFIKCLMEEHFKLRGLTTGSCIVHEMFWWKNISN